MRYIYKPQSILKLSNRAVCESLGPSPESSRESQGPSLESSPESWGAVTRVELRVRRFESRVESSRKSHRLSLELIHDSDFE